MKIESLSIKSVTIVIFAMLGVVAIILSLVAGDYFKRAALDAQLKSLNRVNEVAAQEAFNILRKHAYEIGMKLGHGQQLIAALTHDEGISRASLTRMLDDPFINGFTGHTEIALVQLKIYDLDLNPVAQASMGKKYSEAPLNDYLRSKMDGLSKVDRLKAHDALWISERGPLFSMLVPVGGLRPVGYLEVVADPSFNLLTIGKMIQSPVQVVNLSTNEQTGDDIKPIEGHLPIEYVVHDSSGRPAYRIVVYEDVTRMSQEMDETQFVTISGFLALTLIAMGFALWLISRFLFTPMTLMIRDIKRITSGKAELAVSSKGVKEFNILASAFNDMTEQVRMRTTDLQQLLNLDDKALLCFDHKNEGCYLNMAATELFGFGADEVGDLDINDLFSDEISLLINKAFLDAPTQVYQTVECRHRDGRLFKGRINLKPVSVMGRNGLAIIVDRNCQGEMPLSRNDEQRFRIFEQTLMHLFPIAQAGAGAVAADANSSGNMAACGNQDEQRSLILRKEAVSVMNRALGCWTKLRGKSKVDLAEESKIWPVYLDKSTPTTRTLDKYLNIEKCPKNPRHQRVIDTARFVLKELEGVGDNECYELKLALESYSQQLSGL